MTKDEVFDLEQVTKPGRAAGVDDEGVGDSRTAQGNSGTAPSDSPRGQTGVVRGPLPWVAVAAVLVLAGVVVAERPPSSWQAGIVPVIGTPSEEWFAPVSIDINDWPLVWAGQESVLIVTGDEVRGFNTADGRPLWQVPGEFLRCAQAEPDALVTCVSGQPEEAELIQIDAAGGEVTRTQRPGLLAAAGHDGDLLTIHQDGGEMVLQRDDGAGAVRWSVDLGTRANLSLPELGNLLSTAGDYVLLDMQPSERLWGIYHAEDGEPADEVATWMTRQFRSVSTDPWVPINPDSGDTRYLTPDGVLSEPHRPSITSFLVDDHLDSGIRVDHEIGVDNSEGTVYGHTGDTTEPLWTYPTDGATRLLGRIDGSVLMYGGTHASALDERTGELRWHEPAPRLEQPILSDGEHLLGIDSSAVQLRLTGLDVATGARVFEVSAELTPPGAEVLAYQAHGANLAVLTDEGLTMWSLA